MPTNKQTNSTWNHKGNPGASDGPERHNDTWGFNVGSIKAMGTSSQSRDNCQQCPYEIAYHENLPVQSQPPTSNTLRTSEEAQSHQGPCRQWHLDVVRSQPRLNSSVCLDPGNKNSASVQLWRIRGLMASACAWVATSYEPSQA